MDATPGRLKLFPSFLHDTSSYDVQVIIKCVWFVSCFFFGYRMTLISYANTRLYIFFVSPELRWQSLPPLVTMPDLFSPVTSPSRRHRGARTIDGWRWFDGVELLVGLRRRRWRVDRLIHVPGSQREREPEAKHDNSSFRLSTLLPSPTPRGGTKKPEAHHINALDLVTWSNALNVLVTRPSSYLSVLLLPRLLSVACEVEHWFASFRRVQNGMTDRLRTYGKGQLVVWWMVVFYNFFYTHTCDMVTRVKKKKIFWQKTIKTKKNLSSFTFTLATCRRRKARRRETESARHE